jgi:F-type H+-transporting ATPase subunit epsilon
MMQLSIISPEKVIYEGEIEELIAPTVMGEIAILPHHADLLTQLSEGEMIVKHKGRDLNVAVTGGFLQIKNNAISIVADFAVRTEEIDAKKALEAQQRAEERLKRDRENMSERDFELAQAEIQKAILQLKVVRKRRGPGAGM